MNRPQLYWIPNNNGDGDISINNAASTANTTHTISVLLSPQKSVTKVSKLILKPTPEKKSQPRLRKTNSFIRSFKDNAEEVKCPSSPTTFTRCVLNDSPRQERIKQESTRKDEIISAENVNLTKLPKKVKVDILETSTIDSVTNARVNTVQLDAHKIKPLKEPRDYSKIIDTPLASILKPGSKTTATTLILPKRPVVRNINFDEHKPLQVVKVETIQVKKEKSYDPKEAREFMKEQQKKRRVDVCKSKATVKSSDSEVQRRLKELREKSLKLVKRNVNKANCNKQVQNVPTQEKQNKHITHKAVRRPPDVKINSTSNNNVTKASTYQTVQQQKLTVPLEIPKKIGILRKENAEPLTPVTGLKFKDDFILTNKKKTENKIIDEALTSPPSALISPLQLPESMNIGIRPSQTHVTQSPAEHANLHIPNVKLKSSTQLTHSTIIEQTPPQKDESAVTNANLSYWLKPGGVKVYPYNFIMAIRKKLEAISIPPQQSRLNDDCTPTFSHSNFRVQSKSTSTEFKTNFSSTTLHVPESNTASELSSLKSDSVKNVPQISSNTKIDETHSVGVNGIDIEEDADADATIATSFSSGVQSCLTEREQQHVADVSLLSEDRISDLRIRSGNLKRFKDGHRDLSNTDFQKLLEAFNKSVSYVIEVNEKLYATLQNPPSSLGYVPKLDTNRIAYASQKTQTSPMFETPLQPNDKLQGKVFDSLKSTENKSKATAKSATEFKKSVAEIVPIINLTTPRSSHTSLFPEMVVDQTGTESEISKYSHQANEYRFETEQCNGSAVGCDIATVFKDFHQSDFELSISNTTVGSDTNFRYSTIGFYEHMIKNETKKSQHLSALMKIREKSLVDRTKRQISWLELQKKKYKEKGRAIEISSIKKKQRALLLRLEEEKCGMQKLLKEQEVSLQNTTAPRSRASLKYKIEDAETSPMSFKSKHDVTPTSAALRGFEIETLNSYDLENFLKKREHELSRRKMNVQKLLEWHQRLDREESEVAEIEKKLINFNLNKIQEHSKECNRSPDKKVQTIEKSLNILKNMTSIKHSPTTSPSAVQPEIEEEGVIVSGRKLNKLWHRLTRRNDLKFATDLKYNMTKIKLEEMYQEAKFVVLEENKIMKLFEETQSLHNSSVTSYEQDRDIGEEIEASNSYTEIVTATTISKSEPSSEDISKKFESEKIETNSQDEDLYIKSIFEEISIGEPLINDVSFPESSSMITNLQDRSLMLEENGEIKTEDNSFEYTDPTNGDKTFITTSSPDDKSKPESSEEPPYSIGAQQTVQNEIEQRLIVLDMSLQELSKSFEKLPIELQSPSNSSSTESYTATSNQIQEATFEESENLPLLVRNKIINEAFPTPSKSPNRIMPDIINEAEVLRRQNMDHESVFDNETNYSTSLFPYVREIPNKPPPPYVPPAYGSQFASVFPSADRIMEIILRRTEELFLLEFENVTSANTILKENITNLYERIILDACRELVLKLKPPANIYVTLPIPKNNLKFFNPPNRLATIQAHIAHQIHRIFAVEHRGMRPQTTAFIYATNYRKKDLVDELLVEELIEDEPFWTTFELEELEVKQKVTEEILNILVDEALQDMEESYLKKILNEVNCT